MLAYAAHRRAGSVRRSPTALALIIASHAVVVALALSARTIVDRHREPPIVLIDPSLPDPPPPPSDPVRDHPKTALNPIMPQVIVPQPDPVLPRDPIVLPTLPPDPLPEDGMLPVAPYTPPQPVLHVAARMITPAEDIDPPY